MDGSGGGAQLFGLPRSTVLGVAASAGAVFLGYLVYVDYSRRNAPGYKQSIRERRREAAAASASRGGRAAAGGAPFGGGGGRGGDEMTANDAQAFFMQEVQLGEELMSSGHTEEGAEHIANAVVLCGQPQQLLAIFQQTLSPEQYVAVVNALPHTRERLGRIFGLEGASDGPPMMQMAVPGEPGLVDVTAAGDDAEDIRAHMHDDDVE